MTDVRIWGRGRNYVAYIASQRRQRRAFTSCAEGELTIFIVVARRAEGDQMCYHQSGCGATVMWAVRRRGKAGGRRRGEGGRGGEKRGEVGGGRERKKVESGGRGWRRESFQCVDWPGEGQTDGALSERARDRRHETTRGTSGHGQRGANVTGNDEVCTGEQAHKASRTGN